MGIRIGGGMHVLRAGHPLARAAAVLVCVLAAVPGLVVAGCAGSGPAPAYPLLQDTGLAAVQKETGPAAGQISRFRWSDLPASPLGPRSQPLLAWAGGKLLELGGLKKGTAARDGAAFDPAAGRWHRLASTAPRSVGFQDAVSVWTGRQLFVASGQPGSCPTVRGGGGTPPGCWPGAGLYDPAADRWSVTRLPGQLDGLGPAAAAWDGHDVILAAVNPYHGKLGVAAYDPPADRWQVITPFLPAGHPPRSVAMVVTAGRLFLWSLWDRVTASGDGFSSYSGVDVLVFRPDGAWRDVTGGWPQNQEVRSPVFTGAAILVSPGGIWCGIRCSPPYTFRPGYFADPATLTRKIIPAGPLGPVNPAFIWTGRAIIAVDLNASFSGPGGQRPIRPGDMAVWDPAASRWLGLPAPPGSPGLAAAPLWAGTELLALIDTGRLHALHG